MNVRRITKATLIVMAFSTSIAVASDDLALDVLKKIDVSSFRSSLGPKHYPKGTALEKTEFTLFSTTPDTTGAYYTTDQAHSFKYSVSIINKNQNSIDICFGDYALMGTAKSNTPLRVEKNNHGMYEVKQELAESDHCN